MPNQIVEISSPMTWKHINCIQQSLLLSLPHSSPKRGKSWWLCCSQEG